MHKWTLYTIEHSTRTLEDFLSLLKKYDIHYLIDIRSQPFSKFNPQFNQNNLKSFLKTHNIIYVFMGDSLGGRPSDPSCYIENGKIDYEAVKKRLFHSGHKPINGRILQKHLRSLDVQ